MSVTAQTGAAVAIATSHRKHALILLGIATVAFTVILELIDPSHVSRGPTILDFEFAGSRSYATQIMTEWGAKGRNAAHLSLVLDYGYMLSYGLFFALAGFAIRDAARMLGWRRVAALGTVVPFFALAAAAFDASENAALLLTLAGKGGSSAPPFATVCSIIKFTLIGIAILYVLCGVALASTSTVSSGSGGSSSWRPSRRRTDRRGAAAEDLARAGGRDAPVEIADYDSTWPVAFEAERKRIAPLLEGVEIHHFGSTAVPGLAAKPVIDMIALVRELDAPIAGLVSNAGYQFPEAFNATLTHRRFLCYPTAAHRTHHLHLVDDRQELDRRLCFRDRLRADPALAREYATLKRVLAERYRDDREAYTEAKTAFIKRSAASSAST